MTQVTGTPVPTGTGTPSTAPVSRSVNGQLRLTYPTRGYAVSRNPFAIWSILPLVTAAFVGMAIAEFYGDFQLGIPWFGNTTYATSLTAIVFAVVTCGLMLIPAVSLKGSLNLTHDGITFERGKQHFTAGWDQVTGLTYRRDAGLCLEVSNPQITTKSIRVPGGLYADATHAQVPLRFFGDRQFSILYDIRDRLPQERWMPAVQQVNERPSWMNLAIYAAAVAIGVGAMVAVTLVITQ